MQTDFNPDPTKAKIAVSEGAKAHKLLVFGGRDVEVGNVSVRLHGCVGAKGEVVADILNSIRERRS